MRADAGLSAKIAEIDCRSRATYGAPRIHAELAGQGIRAGCKRVARLMRAAGLKGASWRNWIITTVRDRSARLALDLVERNFSAPAPNRLWVADITDIPTWAGFLYLAVVLDAFSRKIVGWAMETYLRTELVLKALEMALGQRRALGVIHHSDQGSQYTSLAFGKRCDERDNPPGFGSLAASHLSSCLDPPPSISLADRRRTLLLNLHTCYYRCGAGTYDTSLIA